MGTGRRGVVALATAVALAATGAVLEAPPAHAAQPDGRYFAQRTVAGVDAMPRLPGGIEIIDWKARAQALDRFLYDADRDTTSAGTFSTIADDNTYGGWMMPAFYGDIRGASSATAAQQESITILGSLFNSSIAGIDKDVPYPAGEPGETYLDTAKKFFRPTGGVFTNFVGSSAGIPTQQPYNDFWYVMLSNLNFYRLASLYPDWVERDPQVQQYLASIAKRMCDMVDKLGGKDFAFPDNVKGYNFDTDTVITSSNAGTQPDAAAAVAMILIYAWRHSGNPTYLEHARWAMDYLAGLTSNPYYEFAALEALTAASALNAVAGTDYDISKFMGWVIGSRSAYRNWGGNSFRSGSVDLGGATGEFTGREYFFNSIYPLTTLVQLAKYDPSWAKAAGRWALNLTNSARYFLPDHRDASHQSNPEYIGKPEANVLAYEALVPSGLMATGDAMASWSGWGTGPDVTNLATYGMIYTGVLGGLVEKTNVENLLRFDANKTDYFTADAGDGQAAKYPTWLYYNPYTTVKDVEIDLGDAHQDIFDSTRGVYLAKDVTGLQTFRMLGDSATVLVLTPPNSPAPVVSGNTTTIGGVLVNHSTASLLPLPGTDSVESITVAGPSAITAKGVATAYTASVTPDSAISRDVTWSVTGIDGQETTKATISAGGVLTPQKNGQVLVRATATDGSGIYDELRVTLTGQSLAYLSLNKPVTVSDTIDQAKERINDGDTGTRWNGKTGSGNDGHPWVYLDLRNPANLSLISVEWEAAYARNFRIQWANSPSGPWQDIQVFTNQSLSNHAVTRVSDDSLAALRSAAPDGVRYVRMYTDSMANSGWGISIYEFSIDGTYNITQQVTQLAVAAQNGATEITRRQRPLQMTATATPSSATDQRVEWYVYDASGNETAIADIDSRGKLQPYANGRVKVVARSVDGGDVSGEYYLDISGQDKPNLALDQPITASQSELGVEGANDGSYTTRWSSGAMGSDARAAVEVDLGSAKLINSATVLWEVAAAPSFDLQVRTSSSDPWVTVKSGTGAPGTYQDLDFSSVVARYVRLANMPRSSYGGISIWEFEVYGPPLYLRFDLNGLRSIFPALEVPGDQAVEHGVGVGQLPELDLTGYDFLGWNTAADGKGTSYTPQTVFQETGAVTLYAQYRAVVDRSGLRAVVAEAQGLVAAEFTTSSWAGLTEALAAADGALTDDEATQEEVDAARLAVSNAMAQLDRRGDPAMLETLVDMADGLSGKLDGFTDTSVAALRSALTAAKGVLAERQDKTQAQFDTALSGLQSGLDGLTVKVPVPDRSVLQAVYVAAKAMTDGDGRYTAASWSRLQAELDQAKSVLDDGSATQAAIDAAVSELMSAVAGLAVKPVAADKSVLQAVYDSARALSDPDRYTPASWTKLQAELVGARAVLDDSSASQARIDQSASELNAAVAGLVPAGSVAPPFQPVVSRVKLNQSQLRLVKGKSFKLEEGVYFTNVHPAYAGAVVWRSSDSRVASVSSAGTVKAKKAGTVRITATAVQVNATGQKVSASIRVTVVKSKGKAKVTKVWASVPRSMKKGDSVYVTGKYSSSKAAGVRVTYSSSKASVAEVDPVGRIVARGKGTVKITVKAGGTSKTYKLTVR
jgi:hypothetical protein